MSDDKQQDNNKQDEKLLTFLTLQNERLSSHVDKIWEEMKHFSAVLYVLLSAPFFLYKDFKSIGLMFFPLLAIFVALIAIFSIRKESNNFVDALGTVLSIEKRLKFHEKNTNENPAKIVSKTREDMLGLSIDDFIKNESSKPYTVRYWFIFYFEVLITVGFIEVGFIIWNIIRH